MLNNLTNFYNIIKGRMIRTSATLAPTDMIPLGVVNPNYGGGYAPSSITVQDFVDTLPLQPIPTLQAVIAAGPLVNGATVRAGSLNNGFGGGISQIDLSAYEQEWENGVQYYLPFNGTIVSANSIKGDAPDPSYDNTRSFAVGSYYNSLALGKSYLCTNDATGAAEWSALGGHYTPILDGEFGAVTKVVLEDAYYSINNGMVECIIYGTVDLDFALDAKGSFRFTIPTSIVSKTRGNISIEDPNPVNGIVRDDAIFACRDGGFNQTDVPFVAKFTYQYY